MPRHCRFVFGILPLLASLCLAAGPAAAQAVAIFVRSNGWHTEVVIPRGTLPDEMLPEVADFPGATWLSVGWGDAGYFPAREPSLGQTLDAMFRPTPAVLLLTGLAGAPREVFPSGEVVALQVDADGFRGLLAHVAASFDRAGAPRAWAHLAGRHRFSLFYPATGRFHLFSTCNTWTATALAAAGLPVRSFAVMTAEDVMAQIRPTP